jgi:hypothetical protein
MSKIEEKQVMEDSPANKLGIDVVTPAGFKRQIELLASEPVVVAAVGPSGIGKTAIPKQVAAERGAPYVALHMPTMTPEDFHLPAMSKDSSEYYDRRIPRIFQKLLEYVEKTKAENNGVVPPDKRPILSVEELNRAIDKSVTRGAFVMLGDRKIGDVQLDDSIQFVVTMNPTGGGMAVNEFERDPAMRRRLLLFYVAPDYSTFINYADKSGFHPEVVAYLRAHTSAFYDEVGAKSGKVFKCPATWEGVSRICKAFDRVKQPLMSPEARAAFSGYIGTGSAENLVEFIRDRSVTISPEDILDNYTPKSDVRKRVQSMLTIDGGRLDRVTDLITGLSVLMISQQNRKLDTLAKRVGLFMDDLPEEVFFSLISHMTKEGTKGGQESRQWLQKINVELAKEEGYEKSLKKYHAAKDKAKKEADDSGVTDKDKK